MRYGEHLNCNDCRGSFSDGGSVEIGDVSCDGISDGGCDGLYDDCCSEISDVGCDVLYDGCFDVIYGVSSMIVSRELLIN